MFARRVRPTAAAAILLISALPCAAQMRPQQLPKPIPAKPAGTTLPAPDDLAAPPESSTRTASGLAWRMLGAPAAAAERPGPNDKVETRYTGWTTDGRMFDTTEVSGTTREFRVTGVIPGFEEAVQLLSIGEKGRFWIPEALAYPGRPGKPQGMLVFDLELIGITRGPQPILPVGVPPEDAQQSESGLAWVVLEEGNLAAEPPGPADTVLVEYSSWTPDGRLIDTTAFAGDPEAFTLDLTIAGFRETFATMLPGERRQVWIPSELTELDGQHVHAGTVVFDLKLLSYLKPPQTPASVAAIPADAQRSVTGLAWQVLVPGTGDRHPARGQTVEALYAGWTTDGALFDSTHLYGRAARFVLDESMPLGWNEALFGMVTGETRRVWIPEDLAYMGRKDRPRGMLVFEIELVAIHSPEVDASGRTP